MSQHNDLQEPYSVSEHHPGDGLMFASHASPDPEGDKLAGPSTIRSGATHTEIVKNHARVLEDCYPGQKLRVEAAAHAKPLREAESG
jgi:hypothetical protein